MNVAVIGFGNLGKAFVTGALLKKNIEKHNLYVYAKSNSSIDLAKNDYGVNGSTDLSEILSKADMIIFIVKEDVFYKLINQIDHKLFEGKIIISFMAGITVEKMQNVLKTEYDVVRVMPSLSIACGEGVIAHTKIRNQRVLKVLEGLGMLVETDETGIEKFTAFSSCGLGFAAYILNGFLEAGKKIGFDEETCRKMVESNFLHAIRMGDYKHMIDTVATKGGVTEKGIQYLDENYIGDTIYNAVKKSYGGKYDK